MFILGALWWLFVPVRLVLWVIGLALWFSSCPSGSSWGCWD